MKHALIQKLIDDYSWIHLTVGLLGNLMFFVGSVLFLPALEAYKTTGVWLFIVGSFSMLVGALGSFLVGLWNKYKRSSDDKTQGEG